MSPTFSIVIPTIGRVELLDHALASALRQREHFDDYEIVVLDNCSADRTWKYLQGMESARVRIVRNPRPLPQAENWNTAVRLCEGDFIHLLQDDNIAHPHMLATASSALARYKSLDLVYFPARYMDINERPLADQARVWRPEHEQVLRAPDGLTRFAREFTVAASFAVFSRTLFERHGGFDEESPSYPIFLDIEFMLRWMTDCETLVLPESLAMHRMWGGSRSSAEVWSPEMFTSMSYMVNRVFRAAAQSGRLDADGLDEVRRALVQTFLVDVFEEWAAVRRQLTAAEDTRAPAMGQ